MKKNQLPFFACPKCRADLALVAGKPDSDGMIETGLLKCTGCQKGVSAG